MQSELDKYGLGISKEQLAVEVYNAARKAGMDVSILNNKYLIVKGLDGEVDFSFTKSKAEYKWKLTPMFKYGDITKGRHFGQSMYHANGEWFARKGDAEQAIIKRKIGGGDKNA